MGYQRIPRREFVRVVVRTELALLWAASILCSACTFEKQESTLPTGATLVMEEQVASLLQEQKGDHAFDELSEAVDRIHSDTLERIAALRPYDPISGKAPPKLNSPDLAAWAKGKSGLENLRSTYAALRRAELGYGILEGLATRDSEPQIAALAKEHKTQYVHAVRIVDQFIGAETSAIRDSENSSCQCNCQSCSMGLCVCAWHGRSEINEAHGWTSEPWKNGVMMVSPPREGSPAYGYVHAGDHVMAIDGQEIDRWATQQTVLASHKEGADVDLKLLRDGKPINVKVKHPAEHTVPDLARLDPIQKETGELLALNGVIADALATQARQLAAKKELAAKLRAIHDRIVEGQAALVARYTETLKGSSRPTYAGPEFFPSPGTSDGATLRELLLANYTAFAYASAAHSIAHVSIHRARHYGKCAETSDLIKLYAQAMRETQAILEDVTASAASASL
jgi:hypothetical protein